MKWWSAGAVLIFDAPRLTGGRGPPRRYLATAPSIGTGGNRAREETRTDVNFRGRRRDARGSMKTAPRDAADAAETAAPADSQVGDV